VRGSSSVSGERYAHRGSIPLCSTILVTIEREQKEHVNINKEIVIMRTVYADMSMKNRTTEWKIPLGGNTVSLRAIAKPGTVVRVTDDDMEVEAVVEVSNGLLVASPRWDTLAYVH